MGLIDVLGGVFQGTASMVVANKEANTDDICGAKPGIFKFKGEAKDKYNACMEKAAEARINALNADAEQKRNAPVEKQNTWLAPVIISTVIIVTILIAVVVIRKKRK